jgi:hypothetical protein
MNFNNPPLAKILQVSGCIAIVQTGLLRYLCDGHIPACVLSQDFQDLFLRHVLPYLKIAITTMNATNAANVNGSTLQWHIAICSESPPLFLDVVG